MHRPATWLEGRVSEWWLVYTLAGGIAGLIAYHCRLIAPHWPAIRSCVSRWLAGG